MGYNLLNILGSGTVCNINSSNGIVTARSVNLNRFVLGVKCEEYRGGVKIGETIREMPIPSLNCAGSGASNVLEKKIIKKITVFPNPTSGKITIQFDAKFSFSFQIEIYSINGQKVFSTILQDSFNKLDLSKLEKGVYFIKLSKGNEIITKKIVIS